METIRDKVPVAESRFGSGEADIADDIEKAKKHKTTKDEKKKRFPPPERPRA